VDENYPYVGETVDGIYTLVEGIGTGGNDTVYKAEVNLDAFDYAMVAAYRDEEAEDPALELATPEGDHSERVSERLQALRKKDLQDKVRSTVEKKPEHYPAEGVCAVKILNIPEGASDREREQQITRFEQEWKNLMSISHTNVIAIYGGGRTVPQGKETCYYAMEYLEGILYKEEIMAHPLDTKYRLVKQAAEGLKAIHSRDLVHRDIKPSNILVTEDGNVKITDAGIVKDMFKESELSSGQVFIGTPSFESPEQAESIKNVDYRTDIYSLGATFYYWLIGVEPYEDKKEVSHMMDILYVLRRLCSFAKDASRDVYTMPKVPSDVILPTPVKKFQDIPDRAVQVLRKMMNPDRDRFRYQSMDEVTADIDALIEGKPVSAAALVQKPQGKPPAQRAVSGRDARDVLKKSRDRRDRAGKGALKKDRAKGGRPRRKREREETDSEEEGRAPAKKGNLIYIIGGIGSGLVTLLIVILVFVFSEEEPPKKTPKQIEAERIQKEKEERLQELKELHQTVLGIVEKNPGNLDLHEKNWTLLMEKGTGTEYEETAKKELDNIAAMRTEAEKKRQQEAEAEIKKLEQSVAALIEKRKFREALTLCESVPKERRSAFPVIETGITALMQKIHEEARKAADAAVSRSKELCGKQEFTKAREAAGEILGFDMPDLKSVYDKQIGEIEAAEKEFARKKEEEIKNRCTNLLGRIRTCMVRREFKKAVSILDEGAKSLPPEMAEEKLKPERAILVWAVKFMEQVRKRAALKPDDVELTIQRITGKIKRYDPDTDEIEVELKTENIEASRHDLLRNLPYDQLLRLSGWEKPLSYKPQQTLATGCFIVLTAGRVKAQPYFEKITESGLVNSDLEKALKIYEMGAQAAAGK